MIPTADEVQRAKAGIEFINNFIDERRHNNIPYDHWSWLCYQKKECYKIVMQARNAAKDLEYLGGV